MQKLILGWIDFGLPIDFNEVEKPTSVTSLDEAPAELEVTEMRYDMGAAMRYDMALAIKQGWQLDRYDMNCRIPPA